MIQEAQPSLRKTSDILNKLQWSAGPWGKPRPPVLIAGIVIMLLLPWALNPISIGQFGIHLLILIFGWGMVVECWNLIMGVSGIYSFGQLALFAVGGFTSGILVKQFGWTPWLTMWAGAAMTAFVAVIIGLPVLRLKGTYVVLLTLAFHELLRNWILNGPQWISYGGYGLREVPRLPPASWFGAGKILPVQFTLAGFNIDLTGDKVLLLYYYLGLVLFGFCTFAIWRILYSPVGMSFRALRDSETYAVSRGVDPFRFKLFLFAFSAFFTGLAGAFLTHYDGTISPVLLDFGRLINLLAMIALGGWGTFWGPIFGTALLTALPEVLRSLEGYRNFSIGLALALIAMFAPQGLFPALARWVGRLAKARQARQAARQVQPKEAIESLKH
jgi:branched-chain amino acid transport system permease protein